MSHLLLVDDDIMLSPLTREYLEAKGYSVTLRHSGDEGLAAFKLGQFDACILDVKMPLKDGFALAEDIRQIDPLMPILFLTGAVQKEERIRGLSIGADDYITKPFSMEELYLRVRNTLSRSQAQQKKSESAVFEVGKYRYHAGTRELHGGTEVVKLTAIEAKLLQLFCESENGIIRRDIALQRIWGDEDMLKGRSLNVYVSKLRTFLSEDQAIEILNVHGEGYQMVVRR
ncbi:MAG: response regulator transcription factor [Saprospiraceae bacterium]|nr:response regulator transcription factor [Saprospiraceae bacterium]